ncbi:catalase [Acinetobacter baumannii]
MVDFYWKIYFKRKITHFDHERIPERIVHARGVGAHGCFQAYEAKRTFNQSWILDRPNYSDAYLYVFQQSGGPFGSADKVP